MESAYACTNTLACMLTQTHNSTCRADQIGREAVLSKEISRQKAGVETSVFARPDVSDEKDTNTQ